MKAIMVMFDTLNRRMLPPYGCDWVKAPNFQRLAGKAVTFDNCYAGSMPCMPARRELHTGRYNFLHRGWGPLEPFDDSMPEILKNSGVYTHLISDHAHYWEEGGATYHTRYSTWDMSRGTETDPWRAAVADPEVPPCVAPRPASKRRQEHLNRTHMQAEDVMPMPKTFAMGMDFLRENHGQDNWFLTIETFDPHEPFITPPAYKELYPHDYSGPPFDWPPYRDIEEDEQTVRHLRFEYAALVSMCDSYLGKVLDFMDEHDMWKDTMLIVNTDHGFVLGEHGFYGKGSRFPAYNEIAHTPLFIWDPRSGARGERRQALVQTIDLAPTLLDFFGVDIPGDVQGVSLRETIAGDASVREAGIFGRFGGWVNVTDGRYVYMRGTNAEPGTEIHEYTLMPMEMTHTFSPDRLQQIGLAEPFPFTKGCCILKLATGPDGDFGRPVEKLEHMLFDLETDPLQQHPLRDSEIEERMIGHLVRLMDESDAPPEQYGRLGLTPLGELNP